MVQAHVCSFVHTQNNCLRFSHRLLRDLQKRYFRVSTFSTLINNEVYTMQSINTKKRTRKHNATVFMFKYTAVAKCFKFVWSYRVLKKDRKQEEQAGRNAPGRTRHRFTVPSSRSSLCANCHWQILFAEKLEMQFWFRLFTPGFLGTYSVKCTEHTCTMYNWKPKSGFVLEKKIQSWKTRNTNKEVHNSQWGVKRSDATRQIHLKLKSKTKLCIGNQSLRYFLFLRRKCPHWKIIDLPCTAPSVRFDEKIPPPKLASHLGLFTNKSGFF